MAKVPLRRQTLLLGTLWGGLAVGFGAFGAHALRARISPELLQIFETGVRYQMYHALALLGIAGLMQEDSPPALLRQVPWLFSLGVLLFSGSLYILALSGTRLWGMVTPFGGLAFLAGWFLLGLFLLRS